MIRPLSVGPTGCILCKLRPAGCGFAQGIKRQGKIVNYYDGIFAQLSAVPIACEVGQPLFVAQIVQDQLAQRGDLRFFGGHP